ncbi:hypothetical protein TNCV_2560851 [Trichonephila clavipes]|uniref:Uncharacterized protein n=1 Tax=Trichonephila clavipes TaxID=2585209 RepID=A0A8X6USP1_TRICX|nr:hypothetical protein TNCV_2560851 [Trichonephila clavipes]
MDLPPLVSQKSYERILRKINLANREVADDSMKNAAKEEVSASGSNEICVSGDGIAVNEAIVMFNEGMTGRIKIMKALGFKIGHFAVTSAFKANYARIKNAEIKSKSYTLDARRASRMRKKATNEREREHFAELEGPTYEVGSF